MEVSVTNEAYGIDPRGTEIRRIINMDDLVLYAIGVCIESNVRSVDKNDVCKALGISRGTLNGRLSNLVEKKILVIDPNEGSCRHRPTRKGWKKLAEVREAINDTYLVPEIHKREGRLSAILPVIEGPVNTIRIAVKVTMCKPLDVGMIIDIEMAKRPDGLERILFNQLEDAEIILDREFESMVVELTLAGKGPEDLPKLGSTESVGETAMYAEMLRKQSKPEEAFEIFRSVVGRCGAKSGYRVFGLVGMVKCTRSIDEKAALKLTEDFLPTAGSPVQSIMLRKCQADILTFTDTQRALEIYSSCIKSIARKNIPALKAMIHNNMGVAYFEMGNWKEAEKSWKKALKIANDNRYRWLGSMIKLNLADVMSWNGKSKRAKKLLGESKKFFGSVEDMEGISGYHYNTALVSADEGNREMSLKHFRKCLECESIPKVIWERRYKGMNKRFEKMGWNERFPEKSEKN